MKTVATRSLCQVPSRARFRFTSGDVTSHRSRFQVHTQRHLYSHAVMQCTSSPTKNSKYCETKWL